MTRLIPHEQVHKEAMQDPEYARIWRETALAREVALLLVKYRGEHGLSQTALAAQLGMRQPAIARLEAGDHTPSLQTLRRLAETLGLELNLHIGRNGIQLVA